MKGYFHRLFILASQALHCVLMGGNPDLTVSARIHIEAYFKGGRWKKARKIVNGVFFWQKDHCSQSFAADEKHVQALSHLMFLMRRD